MVLQDRLEVDIGELEFNATAVMSLSVHVMVSAEMAWIVVEEFEPCEV